MKNKIKSAVVIGLMAATMAAAKPPVPECDSCGDPVPSWVAGLFNVPVAAYYLVSNFLTSSNFYGF